MQNLYKKYVKEKFDADGSLEKLEYNAPDTFNFAFDVVDEIARLEPQRRAMLWLSQSDEEKLFTFSDISRISNQAANLFRARGIRKGDNVLIILKRHHQFWPIFMALNKIGAVGIPATNQLMTKDVVYRFEIAKVSDVICTIDGEISDHVDEACEKYGKIRNKFIVNGSKEGWESYDDSVNGFSEEYDRSAYEPVCKNDRLLMYFTSGTTGMPKLVAHNHTYPIGHITTARNWHCVVPDGLHYTISETGWAKSMWGMLYGQWFMEAGLFIYDFDRFHADDILSKVQKYKITTFCAPPTMFRFFIQEDLSKYDLSSIRHCTIAGEALNPEVYNKWKEATGLSLREGFGQSESVVLVYNPVGKPQRPGSMGFPSPAFNIMLLDDDGNEAAPGADGEIVIKMDDTDNAYGIFTGYVQDDLSASNEFSDGMYHTGDLAWRDEDGYFWYVSRKDHIIKSSGYRIGPFEIESVLMEHPAVLECAVSGAPDPIRGTVVKAEIVLTKNYTPSDELKKEIQDFVKHQTAPYKYPRIVEFLPELPKTVSGKIKRIIQK